MTWIRSRLSPRLSCGEDEVSELGEEEDMLELMDNDVGFGREWCGRLRLGVVHDLLIRNGMYIVM